jgi:hypothetical protein
MSLKALAAITLEIDISTLADLERRRKEQKGVTTKMINGLTEIKK